MDCCVTNCDRAVDELALHGEARERALQYLATAVFEGTAERPVAYAHACGAEVGISLTRLKKVKNATRKLKGLLRPPRGSAEDPDVVQDQLLRAVFADDRYDAEEPRILDDDEYAMLRGVIEPAEAWFACLCGKHVLPCTCDEDEEEEG